MDNNAFRDTADKHSTPSQKATAVVRQVLLVSGIMQQDLGSRKVELLNTVETIRRATLCLRARVCLHCYTC